MSPSQYERITRTSAKVKTALYSLSNAALLMLVVVLLLNIVFRRYNVGFSGMPLLAQILHIWLVFLIIGNLEIDKKHIQVDFFVKRTSPRIQSVIDAIRLLVCVLSSVVIFVAALAAVGQFWNSTTPTLNLPAPVIHAAPLIGSAILIAVYSIELGQLFRGDADD